MDYFVIVGEVICLQKLKRWTAVEVSELEGDITKENETTIEPFDELPSENMTSVKDEGIRIF